MKKALIALSLASILPLQAMAADVAVTLLPESSQVEVGESLTINLLIGYEGAGNLVGGAVNLSFDASLLQVMSVLLTAPQDIGGSSGVVDNASGSISGLGFADFTGLTSGNYSFATVTFQGVMAGLSTVTVSDANDPVYAWATDVFVNNVPESVSFSGDMGSVLVTAVPEPESWAMLLAGLGLLGGVARRSARQA